MSRRFSLIVIATLCPIVACAGDDDVDDLPIINGIYDEAADFSEFASFDVVEPEEVPPDQNQPGDLLAADRVAITNAIIEELQARGYQRDRDDPDLKLTTFVRYRDTEVVTETAAWNNYYYGWYWGYTYPWYDVDVVDLEAGTLIIDAVDVGEADEQDDDVLVFRGTATGLFPQQATGISARIPAVVAEIFDYWPEPKS